MKIAFIGGGNMATALIAGLLRAGRSAADLCAVEIDSARCAQLRQQFGISAEAAKSGVAPAELPALARAVAGLPRLRLRGLMAIPEPSDDPGEQRAPLAAMRRLFDELRSAGFADWDTLSMGMSADLEAAIEQGATMVRVGTALFGQRAGVG